MAAPDQFDILFPVSEVMNPVEKPGSGVTQDDFGLVLDGDEILKPAFLHQSAPVDNPDPVTDLLDLLEEMRAEKDGEPSLLSS